MTKKRVVAIPGEDAAPEAFHPTVELVDRLGLPLEWVFPPVGQEARESHGSYFPDEARRAIDESDSALFGSTSGPSAPALFYLRWGKRTYANVRPTRWIPGYRSPLAHPEQIDFVIVRENLEDLYVRLEGDVAELAPLARVAPTENRPVHELGPGRYALKVITEQGALRVSRFAFELARRRRREGRPGRVTCGTKHNMLPRSDGLFREVFLRVAREYPDVASESFIVDDFAHRLVARPHELDVVVLPNLYGDILSDAAAALAGGLGLAASGCYGDDYAYFESAHGTAPDIAGKGIINPTATLLSAAMMVEYLGFHDASRRLTRALETVYAEGKTLTPDQGGTASTRAFCAAVEAAL
jgi:isocitrate/isopropylmalate dehydrogenase